jgi:hypothetical protein
MGLSNLAHENNQVCCSNIWGNIMTETKTPVTETDNNENPDTPSDARVILGPLVKYAAMGLVLVGIIITTAVMMDRQLNDIDREVAELEAQLAAANGAAETDITTASQNQKVNTPTVEPVVVQAQEEPAAAQVAETIVAEQAEVKAAEGTINVGPGPEVTTNTASVEAAPLEAAVAENTVAVETSEDDDFFAQSLDQIIAERNAYLKERDLEYLEAYRTSQEKKLELMRERLARQEQRIKEMESRYQEIYDVRAADMKEMQQRRANYMTDRI